MTWRKVAPGIYEGIPGEEKDEELEMRVKLSNIPIMTVKTHRLATWKHRGSEPFWPKIEQYAAGVPDHPFLTLVGTVGTGKTHIAHALAWAWLELGRTVLYYQVEVLLDALRRGYSSWQAGNADGYDNIIGFSRNVGLLILDDFGAQHETEWAVSKLDQIIDCRYEHRRPLVVTTNLALNRLPPRIDDRLSEGLLVQLAGESFRKQKKATRKE
jgi:DNA replication protein DnaC